MADDVVRDIPEEMVEKAARAAFDAMKTGVFAAWSFDDLKVHRHHQERWRTAARDVLSAALAGRQVVDLPAEPGDELAARVLDEHLLTGPRPGQCRCGWGDGSDIRTLGRSHSVHVVEQLRAAGALAGSGSGEG